MDPLPNFGRYEALFRIAAGGMAEVFAARIRGEAGFEKLVAIKRMLPHLAEDEQFVEMFLDEARLAVHVSSPYVVPTLDLGRADDGALYIVMELVVGQSLAALFREQRRRAARIPLPIALELLAQAAQGLDDAHEAVTPTGLALGLVHRDVSPHNLLVGVDGRARVTDFGIARAMLRRTSTDAGTLKGKFAYFSPEQAAGAPLDRRSDVFSLGIVAWETLLGRRLFVGEDPMALIGLVRDLPIPPVHEVDPQIPFGVSQAIAVALERPLERRYRAAAAFANALRGAARALGPAPTAREIGKWVQEGGSDALARMRGEIDSALAGDHVPTVVRVAPGVAPAGDVPFELKRAAPPVSAAPSVGASVPLAREPGEPTTMGAATLSSEPAPARARRSSWVVAGVVAGVAAGVLGAWFVARTSGETAALPAEPAAALPVLAAPASSTAASASTVPAAPPASDAVDAKSKSRRPPVGVPGGTTRAPALLAPSTGSNAPSKGATALVASGPATAAAPAATPAASVPTQPAPAAPPPAAPAPVPKKNGPLLGDDAFK